MLLTLEQEVYRRDAIYKQPDWSFDTIIGRYRNNSTGRFLSEKSALQLTERSIAAASKELTTLTLKLTEKVIDLATWETDFAKLIKKIHIAQFVLGKGGIKNTTSSDFLVVANTLKTEYNYLHGFALDIYKQGLTANQIKARAQLYINKSRLSYWKGRELSMKRTNFSQMKRILAPVLHCQECIEYAKAGWVTIGTLPMPTEQCTCRSNCKCIVVYQ
jgi:hypothetical protein